ncbi:hypothetical protein [Nitrososphaeria virus YSH_462411]|uniref:Uncharacterized protein n=1 Tax=Nitrososphaeria virus YSH_462411 TaxID=3071321 RepID=A0A976YF16_9CAUD|nr:hypothetical protein QKV92_gp49 [Yangshan Harbor Nitrososphaeria virus]UVF62321.1 hypothetical protein [Nitrososphaeria virus YSH_462411]
MGDLQNMNNVKLSLKSEECRKAGFHVLHSYVNRFTNFCYACNENYNSTEK